MSIYGSFKTESSMYQFNKSVEITHNRGKLKIWQTITIIQTKLIRCGHNKDKHQQKFSHLLKDDLDGNIIWITCIKTLPLSFQYNEFHHIHLQVSQRQSLRHDQSEFQIAQLASTRDWIKTCQWTSTIHCVNFSQYWSYPSINPSFLYFHNLFFFLLNSKLKISIHIYYLAQRWMDIKEKFSFDVPTAHFSKMCFIPTEK